MGFTNAITPRRLATLWAGQAEATEDEHFMYVTITPQIYAWTVRRGRQSGLQLLRASNVAYPSADLLDPGRVDLNFASSRACILGTDISMSYCSERRLLIIDFCQEAAACCRTLNASLFDELWNQSAIGTERPNRLAVLMTTPLHAVPQVYFRPSPTVL